MKRKRLLTAAAGALVAAAVAGVAWAAIPGPGNVYTACMLKGIGTIRLIDKSLPATNLMSRCTDRESEISWNREGAPGTNGVSPTVAQLAAGDPHCAAGGASMSDASGNTAYVCNGTNGTNGADGDNFAGTFTSPNGNYTLTVDDSGITLQGPVGRIKLTDTSTEVRADADLKLASGLAAKLEAGGTLDLRGGGLIQLNGCSAGVARRGDSVATSPTTGAGTVTAGSLTVCSG